MVNTKNSKFEFNLKLFDQFLKLILILFFSDYNGFRDFMIPGIMCNITFAIAYTLTAVNLIKERNGQTIERNYIFKF